jgi:hypothetical protein
LKAEAVFRSDCWRATSSAESKAFLICPRFA